MNKIKLPPKDILVPFEGLAEKLANGDAAEQLNWFIDLRAAVNEGRLAVRYPSGRQVRVGTMAEEFGIKSPHLLVGDIGDWLTKQGFDFYYAPIKQSKKTAQQQDKEEVQIIAKELWEKDSSLTQSAISQNDKLAAYAKKYTGKNTLIGWIREVDQRPMSGRRGRPSKIHANEKIAR